MRVHSWWRDNKYLWLSILLLWSYGRLTSPLMSAVLTADRPTMLAQAAVGINVLLHLLILFYTGTLVLHIFKHAKTRRRWDLVLYGYVLISLVVSLYFLAYQLGIVPGVVLKALLWW